MLPPKLIHKLVDGKNDFNSGSALLCFVGSRSPWPLTHPTPSIEAVQFSFRSANRMRAAIIRAVTHIGIDVHMTSGERNGHHPDQPPELGADCID